MKSCVKLIGVFIISLGACLVLFPDVSSAWLRQFSCADVRERGYINVLSINLLYSEFKDREIRLQTLADFIAQHTEQGEPVDIILLQEVVGGYLSGTESSSQDLRDLLYERGLPYNLQTVATSGIQGIIEVGNAILSRCRILFSLVTTLPSVWEEPSENFGIPLTRKAMVSRIKIPGYGSINVYNTHLCAFCETEERLTQSQSLLEFIANVEKVIWWSTDPIIVGGDFNIDLNTPDGDYEYNEIIDFGLIDTYAIANGCYPCCSHDEDYLGCTYGVTGNPYADEPARIDYIFIKGLDVLDSDVVFNSDPTWVSDHSGVLSKISLD
jgi:maltose 6'-phosphate phosphatase